MARDVSIVISAKDNFTTAITSMKNANNAFDKDLGGLSNKLDALNKMKVSLKVETDKAKTSLKDAEKAFKETQSAADKLNLELANMEYDTARRNLNLVSQNAKQAEKDILSLTNAVSKADNKAGSSVSSGMGSSTGGIGALASAGLTKMAGDALANTANTLASSAFGNEVGTMFSNVLGSAATGAALGTAIAPGLGTAIGGAVGGVVGLINGATSNYETKDDAFKDYYQTQYNNAQSSQATQLESGTTIASTREQNKISFGTLLGGDDNATSFLKDLTQFASETPFEYDDLTSISKTLLAYGYGQQEILPLLTKVGDAGSALGMGVDDMRNVATALGRMQTTGKTTMEYLNPLLERGIDVWSYLSEASGKSKKEVQEMVSKGLVPGEKAAKAIADYMGFNYDGNMEKQAQTYQGLVSTLQDAQAEIDNAMGEGYTETRKKGLIEQIDYLSDNSGLENAYKQIGEWKASLENLNEEYQRDALTAVMTGVTSDLFSEDIQSRLTQMYKDYVKYSESDSEEAGAKMGALLAEAQVIAQNEYNASEGAQLALQTNKDLANQIKNDTGLKADYWDAGYEMGQQFSLGMSSSVLENIDVLFPLTENQKHEKEKVNNGYYGVVPKGSNGYNLENANENPNAIYVSPIESNSTTPEQEKLKEKVKSGYYGVVPTGSNGYNVKNHAYGLSYVPYDGYPAILHQGERVMTASENRSQTSSPQVTITGNTFVVKSEDSVQEILNLLTNKIIEAIDLAG